MFLKLGRDDFRLTGEPVIDMVEVIYYSRRLSLMQRGVPWVLATHRAMKLARYMEKRIEKPEDDATTTG